MKPEHLVEKKYILCRRVSDDYNEVIEAGPKTPSAIGLKDFKAFIAKLGLHPLEVAQFLKVSCDDIKNLIDHQSWIDVHAQDNLICLCDLMEVKHRRAICKFLMAQDGNIGGKNLPTQKSDFLPDH